MPDQTDDRYAPDAAPDPAQLLSAAPEALDAHRSMLSEIMQTLQGQGINTASLANQSGASTADPAAMTHSDLVAATLALARAHPEVVTMVAQRFPQAQGLLNTLLTTGNSGNGNGLSGLLSGGLSGLLGRL